MFALPVDKLRANQGINTESKPAMETDYNEDDDIDLNGWY
jgi:hypothetical protein